MRIVIVDLHYNGFMLHTLENLLYKRKFIGKHKFFLEEALENGYEVINYITGTKKILHLVQLPLWMNRLEAAYVIKKNGLKGKISNIASGGVSRKMIW